MSTNTLTLFDQLEKEILPSLLIRQSALFKLNGSTLTCLHTFGLEDLTSPPSAASAFPFQPRPGSSEPFHSEAALAYPWLRLKLPLTLNDQLIGYWLLGRHDPDDFYAIQEIEILKSLVTQISIVLTNVSQAEELMVLYQTNIERQEDYLQRLQLDLHEHLLNGLVGLKTRLENQRSPATLTDACQHLIVDVRRIVTGLRPTVLDLGLYSALDALKDEFAAQAQGPIFSLDVIVNDEEAESYPPRLTEHIYRIAQEACANALRHGHPAYVKIYGTLAPDRIELVIADDGMGFEASKTLNRAELEINRHYGLANMDQRAKIIGATLAVMSAPRAGTQVHLLWQNTGD